MNCQRKQLEFGSFLTPVSNRLNKQTDCYYTDTRIVTPLTQCSLIPLKSTFNAEHFIRWLSSTRNRTWDFTCQSYVVVSIVQIDSFIVLIHIRINTELLLFTNSVMRLSHLCHWLHSNIRKKPASWGNYSILITWSLSWSCTAGCSSHKTRCVTML